MGWEQILTLFFANAGLIIWFRSESRADHRQVAVVAFIPEINCQNDRGTVKSGPGTALSAIGRTTRFIRLYNI